MDTNNTRRKLLKLVSAGSVLGLMDTATASSKEETVYSSEVVTRNSTDAISVTNNSTSTEEVEITLRDSTHELSEAQVRLSASVEPKSRVIFGTDEVDVTGGTYEVTVDLTNHGATASTLWKLPEGGVPHWRRISAHIKPDSSIKIYNEEE